MTQDEAQAILSRQVYRVETPEGVVEFVGVDALVAGFSDEARKRGRDPIEAAVVGIAEYMRLGAAPMPETPKFRELVEVVTTWLASVRVEG